MPQKTIHTTMAKNACNNFEELAQRVPMAYMTNRLFGGAGRMPPGQAKEVIMNAWKVYLSKLPENIHYQELWKRKETEEFRKEIVEVLKAIIGHKKSGE